MPSTVPTPVAAVIGLVPAVLGGVRALPGKAVQLPIYAVSSVLTGLDTARRGYDDLAERGEQLVARLRGASFDELEDRVEDALAGTPLARPYDVVEDALEDVTDTVTAFARAPRTTARKVAATVTTSAAQGLETAADAVEELADKAGDAASGAVETVTVEDAAATVGEAADQVTQGVVPVEQAAKGRPTPKATEPDSSRVESAASPEVVAAVERVSAVVGSTVVDHDELPLPDYDHLTLGAVRGRMRSLDLPQLLRLRDYEKAKANRLPVVTMLDNRIAKLASDPTAPLSGGDVSGPSDKASSPKSPAKGGKKGGSKVTPATSSDTTSTPRAAFGGLGGATTAKG